MYEIKTLPEDFIVIEKSSIKTGSSGRYSYFALKKKDYTTEKAVQAVANYLGIERKKISYAGSKDRRAVTEQVISVLGKAREISIKGITTNLLGFGNSPVSLGDLEGNDFRITIRNLTGKNIEKAGKNQKAKHLRIMNYFDEQRFSRHNSEIGKHIVKGRFKAAVKLVLEGEGDFERKVNDYLEQNPTDFVGALRAIPRKILQLYVHAFQSEVWNSAAEKLGKSKANISIPLVGFGTELEGKAGKTVSALLKKEKVDLRDFIIRQIPELSSEGSSRALFAEVKNLKIIAVEEDELNKGKKKVVLEFSLPKGSYATLVIKNIFG